MCLFSNWNHLISDKVIPINPIFNELSNNFIVSKPNENFHNITNFNFKMCCHPINNYQVTCLYGVHVTLIKQHDDFVCNSIMLSGPGFIRNNLANYCILIQCNKSVLKPPLTLLHRVQYIYYLIQIFCLQMFTLIICLFYNHLNAVL